MTAPSSYIKTEDAPVTRAADNVSRVLGEEFNASEGTLFVDFTAISSTDLRQFFSIISGNGTNLIFSRRASASSSTLYIAIMTKTGERIFSTFSTLGQRVKVACSFKKGYAAIAVDGEIKNSGSGDYSGYADSLLNLSPHMEASHNVHESRVFPRALSEAELVELTK